MKNQKLGLLILIISMAIGACTQIQTPPKNVVCPPLQQNCYAEQWKGLSVDTSLAYRIVADTFYIFENLKQINSPEDEWSLSFLDSKKAVITFTDADQQRIMMLRFSAYNRASVESGIGIPVDGSIGALSLKDKKAVFAIAPMRDDPDNIIGNSDLYTADLQGNILVNLKKLSESLSKDQNMWDSHPSFSKDKNIVFFSSDRPPSLGTDLWFSVLMPDGSWSKPINCGDSVNSNCDEITPFLTNDGKTLLFSSAGHETVGGYDIFSCDISKDFWQLVNNKDLKGLSSRKDLFSNVKNLRAPLNSVFDEMFPSTPDNYLDLLYYSSNQNQGYESVVKLMGGFDLYVRKKEVSQRLDNKQKTIASDVSIDIKTDESKLNEAKVVIAEKYSLSGKVYNASTNGPIPRADIIVRKTEQIKTSETIPNTNELELTTLGSDLFYDTFSEKADSNGSYCVWLEKGKEYEVTAQSERQFFDSYKIRLEKTDTTSAVVKDFHVPETITLRINFPTDKYNSPYKYALDSNGVETNYSWQEEIENLARNILLAKDKLEKLIIIGHTDDVGSVAYNEKLAENRVNFVINQLVQRGVPREMLEGRAAGELEPLPPLPGEPLQLYRKRLRRVELQKVMKS